MDKNEQFRKLNEMFKTEPFKIFKYELIEFLISLFPEEMEEFEENLSKLMKKIELS
jgi:hypothetical protein